MKKLCLILIFWIGSMYGIPTLNDLYKHHTQEKSDIHEHLPILRDLARECSSVVEIGVREMVSTWGLLQGLSESVYPQRSYIGIDLGYPSWNTMTLADQIATKHNISFSFWKGNDMQIDLPETDLLFIDSLHTYCHLTYELEKFAPKVKRYIALHDTSPPWEWVDDNEYRGDYSEYPIHINRLKRGLWPAVVDFLSTHSEWTLKERRTNCHGLTILEKKRVPSAMKVLFTSALIPHQFEERKREYIHSLNILQEFGFLEKTYVIESGHRTERSFFEELIPNVFYSGTNNPALRNKGVNEAMSLINFSKFHPIQDEEIVVKLTGRYYFQNDTFIRYVEKNPSIDAIVSSRDNELWKPGGRLQCGCFALKGKYFKRWLQSIDLIKLEEEMIDLEDDLTRFIEGMIRDQAKVEVWDKIGVTAHVAGLYYHYY